MGDQSSSCKDPINRTFQQFLQWLLKTIIYCPSFNFHFNRWKPPTIKVKGAIYSPPSRKILFCLVYFAMGIRDKVFPLIIACQTAVSNIWHGFLSQDICVNFLLWFFCGKTHHKYKILKKKLPPTRIPWQNFRKKWGVRLDLKEKIVLKNLHVALLRHSMLPHSNRKGGHKLVGHRTTHYLCPST